MTGRDEPRVFTSAKIRSLLGDSETLRGVGYETGDFVPLVSFGIMRNRVESTTSTTYTDVNQIRQKVVWDDIYPGNSTSQAALYCNVLNSPGDIRLRNSTDSETILEKENVQGDVAVGPTDYRPTTSDSIIIIELEWRTNNGGNATEIHGPCPYLGVQI